MLLDGLIKRLEEIGKWGISASEFRDRLDQFGKICAAQQATLSRESEHFLHWPVNKSMERILAANPETSREDAFFQAVIEIAEGKL